MADELRDPYEYEVDLRDYIKVIWEQKWLILAIFVLAMGLAAFYSVRQPSIYRTEVTLLITPRVSEQIIQGGESGLTSVSLPPLAYERSALAADLVERIINDLDLKDTEGEPISVASLRGRMEINVEEKTRATSAGETVKIPLITMSVKGQKPERLKEVTNKWAQLFQDRITELFASETARSFEFISRRFSEVKNELGKLEQERLSYKKNHSVQVLKNEVDVLETTHKKFMSQLESQRANLEAERARLNSLQETVAEEPKFFEPERSLPSENLWNLFQGGVRDGETEGTNDNGPENLEDIAGLRIVDQQINEAYVSLNEEMAMVKADVASLEKEVSYLDSKLTELEEKIIEKQGKIDETELKLQEFDREISRLNATYDTLSSNLEEARIAKEEKESSTRIMEKAVAPEKPRSTDTKQNVAVAGVLGLFVGVLAAFFRNYMKGYEEEQTEEEEEEKEE